jgi:hypothetical protein
MHFDLICHFLAIPASNYLERYVYFNAEQGEKTSGKKKGLKTANSFKVREVQRPACRAEMPRVRQRQIGL